MKKRSKSSGGFFEIDEKERELKALDKNAVTWKNPDQIKKLGQKRASLSSTIEEWRELDLKFRELKDFIQLVKEEGDPYLKELCLQCLELSKNTLKLEMKSFLRGPHDAKNAYLSIFSGAGGTEAQDWSLMLYRMYLKWIEKKNFKVEVISFLEGEEAGLKSAILKITGPYAFGFLKSESGVHRLVRISPFDANSRRHTSFSSLFVWPEMDENIQIEIKNEDVRVDTYRASGAGGQHVNKTDSAVRLTHLPTGKVVQCQNQRSQHANKNQAMKILKSILHQLEMEKLDQEKQKRLSSKKANEWGSQIRSYVLHPYQMVKDHRTGVQSPKPLDVLDGGLDLFISAFLKL